MRAAAREALVGALPGQWSGRVLGAESARAPDELPDGVMWNYLVKLGLLFAVVVAAGAIYLLAYAFEALFYIAGL
jgi:hypothetical protein